MNPLPTRTLPLFIIFAMTGVLIPGRAEAYEAPTPDISIDGVTATVSWQGNGVLISSADLHTGCAIRVSVPFGSGDEYRQKAGPCILPFDA